MNWNAERWRKLYTRLSPSWLALPVLTRGLGAELLKYVDDDGSIPLLDEEPCEAIVRIVAAHKRERDAVATAVESLIKDGYLVVEPGRVRIRNFVAAQARSTGADRQARYRARVRGTEDVPPSSVTNSVTRDALPSRDEVTDRALPLPLSGSGSSSQHIEEEVPETARAHVAGDVPEDRSETPPAPPATPVVAAPPTEAVAPDQVPQAPAEILAELRKHPPLAQAATSRVAEMLLGRAIQAGKRMAWVAEAIADCARDAASDDAAERPWGASLMAKSLAKYVDRARAPRPAQGPRLPRGAPRAPAAAAPDVEARNERIRRERIAAERAEQQNQPVSEVPFL